MVPARVSDDFLTGGGVMGDGEEAREVVLRQQADAAHDGHAQVVQLLVRPRQVEQRAGPRVVGAGGGRRDDAVGDERRVRRPLLHECGIGGQRKALPQRGLCSLVEVADQTRRQLRRGARLDRGPRRSRVERIVRP